MAKLLAPQAVDETPKGKSGGNSSTEKESRQDKGKENGDDKDKDKKEEMQKILQLVADGKMTVEQALAKLAEKKGDDKEDDDKDKEDKDKRQGQGRQVEVTARRDGTSTLKPPLFLISSPDSVPCTPVPTAWARLRDRQGTITADLYLGAPLWHGAEFHADLLMWQGFGLSNSFGLEAFPDADAYKAGTAGSPVHVFPLLCSPNLRPGRGTGGRARRPIHATRQTGRFAANDHRRPAEHGGAFRL